MADGEQKTKGEDVLLVHSPTEDGRGWQVLRKREERIEVGALHPTEEGKPLRGELVKLTQREGTPLFDVDVQYAPPRVASGPPQVATDAYRAQWDAIFGGRARSDLARSDEAELPPEQRAN